MMKKYCGGIKGAIFFPKRKKFSAKIHKKNENLKAKTVSTRPSENTSFGLKIYSKSRQLIYTRLRYCGGGLEGWGRDKSLDGQLHRNTKNAVNSL